MTSYFDDPKNAPKLSNPAWNSLTDVPENGALPYRLVSPQGAKNHPAFTLDLINADHPLPFIVERLKCSAADPVALQGLNMCLSGAPGTGKSEFARYLADQMGLKVVMLYAADVMYGKVGATERILEQFFQKAASQKAALIIDEADSFLYHRRSARQPWESQLVNEYLRHLDRHTMPVFCTTNRFESLDPAVLRRMLFKVNFNTLLPEQVKLAFQRYFNRPAPDYLTTLPALTLGDFGLVYRKAKALGCIADDASLCQMFYQEVLARHQHAAPESTGMAMPQSMPYTMYPE